jgi:hypothetical protein
VTIFAWRGIALIVSVVCLGGDALATERSAAAQSCINASEAGTKAEDRGALRDARRHFVSCALPTCPAVIRTDCAHRVEEIDAVQPTVIIGAKDARGADLTDFRVVVDGEDMTAREPGRALLLDPGPHVIRVEHPGKIASESKVLIRSGERDRSIVVTLGDVTSTEEPEKEKPLPVNLTVAGGIGAVALVSFTYFGLKGLDQRSCAPNCTSDQVADVRTSFIVADVSLIVGLASLGVAAYLALTTHRE